MASSSAAVARWNRTTVAMFARGGRCLRVMSGQYVRETTGTGATSSADEHSRLADLRDQGSLSVAEFEAAKAKVLGTPPAPAAVADTDGPRGGFYDVTGGPRRPCRGEAVRVWVVCRFPQNGPERTLGLQAAGYVRPDQGGTGS